MSEEFRQLLGGVRTRQLAKLIAEKAKGKDAGEAGGKHPQVCGLKAKDTKQGAEGAGGKC